MYSSLFVAAAFAAVAFASPVILQARAATALRYEPQYDNKGQSMDTVSCSNGENGLSSKWATFGGVPHFDDQTFSLAASPEITWNSPNCGTCYKVTYKGKTATIMAVDQGSYNIGLKLMNYLTDGKAVELGTIQADVVKTDCPK